MAKPSVKTRFQRYSHQWLDLRDLAMAQLIAGKIRRDPGQFRKAVNTLRHWKRKLRPVPEAVLEWDRIFLTNTRERVLEMLVEDSEEGQRRRQSDPFCGILTERERVRFLNRYDQG